MIIEIPVVLLLTQGSQPCALSPLLTPPTPSPRSPWYRPGPSQLSAASFLDCTNAEKVICDFQSHSLVKFWLFDIFPHTYHLSFKLRRWLSMSKCSESFIFKFE